MIASCCTTLNILSLSRSLSLSLSLSFYRCRAVAIISQSRCLWCLVLHYGVVSRHFLRHACWAHACRELSISPLRLTLFYTFDPATATTSRLQLPNRDVVFVLITVAVSVIIGVVGGELHACYDDRGDWFVGGARMVAVAARARPEDEEQRDDDRRADLGVPRIPWRRC